MTCSLPFYLQSNKLDILRTAITISIIHLEYELHCMLEILFYFEIKLLWWLSVLIKDNESNKIRLPVWSQLRDIPYRPIKSSTPQHLMNVV